MNGNEKGMTVRRIELDPAGGGSRFFTDILLVAVFVAVCATEGWPGDQRAGEKKTITRRIDHVVVNGSELKEGLGKTIDRVVLYSFSGGAMHPIPFQIDEITEKGEWVLPEPSPLLGQADREKVEIVQDDPPGVIDENDELAFMVSDAGDRVDSRYWPPDWISTDEITLIDPLTGERAWVYLFSFRSSPSLSEEDYVGIRCFPDRKEEEIFSGNYRMSFSQEVPITWDLIRVGDGPNIIDRLKIRLHSYRLFHLFDMDWDENDFHARCWQYKDGPIRLIRKIRNSIRLVGKLESPELSSVNFYYPNAVLTPKWLRMPYSPRRFVEGVSYEQGLDFRDLSGWEVKFNSDGRWFPVDGRMDDRERSLTVGPAEWFILRKPGKAVIVRLMVLTETDIDFPRTFRYVDDRTVDFPPEFHPGQGPYIGYQVHNLKNIRKGMYHFYVLIFLLNGDYSDTELRRAVDIYDNPLMVEVKGMAKNDGADPAH